MTTADSSVVVVESLAHSYGDRRALEGVSFNVTRGELFGLVGPNGGGKSTLLGILATLIRRPSGGAAKIDDLDVVTAPAAVRRRIGVVFQSSSLDDHLSVEENLRWHGRLYGIGGVLLDRRVEENLSLTGVADRASDRIATLSGGMRRRVELAKGLLHRPVVLLLDEPTAGLDPGGRREFWDHLRRLRERDGVAVLAATHLMEEAERCDRIAILDRGRIVAMGTPDALRSGIRGEVITLETDNPVPLAGAISERFDVETVVVDGAVRIERPDGAAFVPRLAEAFPAVIRSITVGKPTLEDVFVQRTGRAFIEDRDA